MGSRDQGWAEVYRKAAGDYEIREGWKLHAGFIQQVIWAFSQDQAGRRLLEVGVGSGAFIAGFAEHGYQVLGIDNVPSIQQAVNEMLEDRGLADMARVGLWDAARIPYGAEFSVAYSQGLMEHFEEDQVSALLWEQLRVARYVVFSVPTPAWVNPRVFQPEYRRESGAWVNYLDRLGFKVVRGFEYWERMHACIVLSAADNVIPRAVRRARGKVIAQIPQEQEIPQEIAPQSVQGGRGNAPCGVEAGEIEAGEIEAGESPTEVFGSEDTTACG